MVGEGNTKKKQTRGIFSEWSLNVQAVYHISWMKGKVLMKGNYIAFGNTIKENMFDELFEQ